MGDLRGIGAATAEWEPAFPGWTDSPKSSALHVTGGDDSVVISASVFTDRRLVVQISDAAGRGCTFDGYARDGLNRLALSWSKGKVAFKVNGGDVGTRAISTPGD